MFGYPKGDIGVNSNDRHFTHWYDNGMIGDPPTRFFFERDISGIKTQKGNPFF